VQGYGARGPPHLVHTTPGVSYSATWAGPSVKAPSLAVSVVLVLDDTADTCCTWSSTCCSAWHVAPQM
jgi:hypothetical protein